jgi:hypothetical protein
VNIELEERKTLEFFQELCALDNPYLKKVTDFNNEFLKLAEEAIAHQEDKEESIGLIKTSRDQKYQQEGTQNNDGLSVASECPSNGAVTDMDPLEGRSSTGKSYTASSEKRVSREKERKMGIGGQNNKAKNAMKDFIMSTLSKNKAEGCYVIKKGGPPKPQPAYTVNERGHLVSSNTLQPISTKNIKSTPPPKPQTTPITSTKNLG